MFRVKGLLLIQAYLTLTIPGKEGLKKLVYLDHPPTPNADPCLNLNPHITLIRLVLLLLAGEVP